MTNTLVFGCDHGGYNLKNYLLKEVIVNFPQNYKLNNQGCFTGSSCDYPDFAKWVCDKVLCTPNSLGILICGTGIGMSIAANKIKDIRCALCTNVEMALMARKHNNANVLALGGRILENDVAKDILITFCETQFEGGRHQRRLNKISSIDEY